MTRAGTHVRHRRELQRSVDIPSQVRSVPNHMNVKKLVETRTVVIERIRRNVHTELGTIPISTSYSDNSNNNLYNSQALEGLKG